MICNICKEDLPEEEFMINCGRYYKASPNCNSCRKEERRKANRSWYEKAVEDKGGRLVTDRWGTHIVYKK